MVVLGRVSKYVQVLNDQKLVVEIVGADYLTSGVDADIFILHGAGGERYALKKSRDNFFDNANDINQDDAQLFRQEAEFARLMNGFDLELKTPEIIYCHTDFLVMEYIEDDGRAIAVDECVNLLSQLHASTRNIPLSLLPISHEGHEDVAQALADRMLRRIDNLHRFLKIDFTWLNKQMIIEAVQSDENKKCLLHMDFRHNNLLQNCKGIYVIDWANALVGSPLLEIARLEVYGELTTDLQAQYLAHNPEIIFNQTAYNIYLLDTAIMMNLVFLSSAPNAEMAIKHEDGLRKIIQDIL